MPAHILHQLARERQAEMRPFIGGGDMIRDVLDRMGAEVSLDSRTLTVAGDGRPSGIDVDLHDAAELTPVVAAVAACADGPSIIRGVAHIRGHETDRISALSRELGGLGVGAASVFKAVYIDKRELKCACVGGSSNVPLGFVSLLENVMMVAMAIWMVLGVAH